ncbi:hypothetical protein [Bradyrhizobium liaoningense]|uniref:hypothetical protein n=1 Tax=Bradyrhizobium liaoningense TaxID=43992 RepID=UPI0004B0677F|nr:hypothetical protein [Bradyrhizobium liaoningense]
MAVDDRGIVVGITTYPDIAPLQGPELDAEEFFDWLTSSSGGDVPADRVDKIVSSDFQPAAPAAAARLPAQEVAQAFHRLQSASLGTTGIPRRLGRRLYVYAAGHGAALPFGADPERSDAAFLVADATKFNATHVMTKVHALYFLNAGIFDEIAVFMDCCRIPINLIPNYPNYINANAIDTLENERRTFFAFATKWGLNAREKPFNGVTRGIFTTALIAGLKGAAANPDGTVTSRSLRDYLLLHMKDLLTETEQRDPFIPKRPDIPAPAVEFVFTTVPPQRVNVTVTFPMHAANQPIRVRGEGFRIVASGQTVGGTPWRVPDPLPKGGYLVQIPGLGLEKEFTLIGNEGMFDVAIG